MGSAAPRDASVVFEPFEVQLFDEADERLSDGVLEPVLCGVQHAPAVLFGGDGRGERGGHL